MAKKMKKFHVLPKFGPEKCPVYLRLPWLGSVSTPFEEQVKSAVKQCFSAVEIHVVYSTTNKLLSARNKDALPALRWRRHFNVSKQRKEEHPLLQLPGVLAIVTSVSKGRIPMRSIGSVEQSKEPGT